MAKQNTENMEKVREAMRLQGQVAQGGKLEHAINVDYVSEEGNHYKGVVVVRKPTAMDVMKIGGLTSEFLRLGGAKDVALVSNGVKYLAHVLATLSILAVKRPEWMKDVTVVDDVDVLYHVYDQYSEWESSFRIPSKGVSEINSESSEGEETMDAP